MYCQSIKCYDSSHCIIRRKYYFPIMYYYSNIQISVIIQISIMRTKRVLEPFQRFHKTIIVALILIYYRQ